MSLKLLLTNINYEKMYSATEKFFISSCSMFSGICAVTYSFTVSLYVQYNFDIYPLKVVGNEKVGGSRMCQTVPIWLGPRRSMFFSLSILLSSLILCISVSAPVKQNE